MVDLPRCTWRHATPKISFGKHTNQAKKSFPLFGKIIGVTWKGQDRNHGLAKKLSDDVETDNLATGIGNIRVQTLHEDFNGWSIEIDRRFDPTPEIWKSLQRVADISVKSIAYF